MPSLPPPEPADGAFAPPPEWGKQVDGVQPGGAGPMTGPGLGAPAEAATRPAAAAAGPLVPVEAMDRLSRHLSMAAFRLAGLRRRLLDPDETLILNDASDELDEAIAEIRRLALMARRGPGG